MGPMMESINEIIEVKFEENCKLEVDMIVEVVTLDVIMLGYDSIKILESSKARDKHCLKVTLLINITDKIDKEIDDGKDIYVAKVNHFKVRYM